MAVFVFFLLFNSFFLGQDGDAYYYWSWGQHLAWGYLDGPPLVAYVMRGFSDIFGNNLFAINFFAICTTLGACFFVYKVVNCLTNDQRMGWTAALLWLITSSRLLKNATYNNVEQLFWIASLFFILDYLKTRANRNLYWASISLSLLCLSKYSGFILLLGVFSFFLYETDERAIFKNKHLYLGGLLFVLILSPHLVWNATHHWETFIFQSHAHPRWASSPWGSMFNYLSDVIGHYAYPLALLTYLIIKHPLVKEENSAWRLLWHTTLVLLFFWLYFSYANKVHHSYLQALNLLLSSLLAYYLIKFQYVRTLWFTIFIYFIGSVAVLLRQDLADKPQQYDLQLLRAFSQHYLRDAHQQVVAGNDFQMLSKLLLLHPLGIVSSTPLCDVNVNQFRDWNIDFQQALKTHHIDKIYYVDIVDKPQCIRPYFKKCTSLPTLEYISPHQHKTLGHLYVYQCQN